MSFAYELNHCCALLGCTNTELAKACGIAPSTLSRYRSGARTPVDSRVLADLSSGIVKLAAERGVVDAMSEREILARLTSAVGQSSPSDLSFGRRLDEIMTALSISNAEMARSTNVDPSYLSRIRRGQRNPYDVDFYANLFSRFVAHRVMTCNTARELPLLGEDMVLVSDAQSSGDEMAVASALSTWLLRRDDVRGGSGAEHLLSYLDSFDFNDYLKAAKIDELKVATASVVTPRSRFYYGLEDMRKAELDFLRTVATAPKVHEATFYSNMSITEMGSDSEFTRHYVTGMAALLKRGIHLNIIHDIMRPFDEMIMGLEGYIPLYMTGQISPFYLRDETEGVFCQLMNASSVAMLQAECIRGNHDDGRYYFSTKPEDVQYGMHRAKQLLDRAMPLMKIYRADAPASLERFKRGLRELEVKGTGEEVGAHVFRNLRIMSYANDLVIISKLDDPVIYFEIRHPMLCHAIVHMEPALVEAARI